MKFATEPSQEFFTPAASIETIKGLPAIQLPGDGHLMSYFASELGALVANAGIYSRKGVAFVLDKAGEKLKPADPIWLRTWAEKSVVPYHVKMAKEGEIKIAKTMPDDAARAVLVSDQFLERLQSVERFHPLQQPWMRSNRKIELLPVGIDKESGTFTADPGFEIEPMTLDDSKKFIDELLSEFPFPDDGGRSKSVAISAMLTVFAEGILPPGAIKPVFIYVANAEGSGKTTLAQLAGLPYSELSAENAPAEESEWQKRILALVLSGRRAVLIDNAKGHLNSPSLEAYTTSRTFRGRILGTSREFEGEAGAVVLITGNGLTVTPDLRRRALFAELFMQELRAEDRTFRRRLTPATIAEIRRDGLCALWGLIRAWDEAGRPRASRSNSSFPEWCETIAGIVEFAGWVCPVAPADLSRGGDTDTSDFQKMAGRMKLELRYTFAELVELAEDEGLFEKVLADRDNDGNLSRAAKRIFSAILARYDRRRVTPTHIFSLEGHGHQRRYCLTSTP